ADLHLVGDRGVDEYIIRRCAIGVEIVPQRGDRRLGEQLGGTVAGIVGQLCATAELKDAVDPNAYGGVVHSIEIEGERQIEQEVGVVGAEVLRCAGGGEEAGAADGW